MSIDLSVPRGNERGSLYMDQALAANVKAMSYIVEHCVQDVLVLEKVIRALKSYSGTYNAWGSGY